MEQQSYKSMETRFFVSRRNFIKTGSAIGTGLILGNPTVWAQQQDKNKQAEKPKTNIQDILKIPRKKNSVPGRFP